MPFRVAPEDETSVASRPPYILAVWKMGAGPGPGGPPCWDTLRRARSGPARGPRGAEGGGGVRPVFARFKGVDFLRPGEPIYTEDLEACAAKQRVRVEPGDIVLVRTGDVGRRVRERSWGTFSAGDAPGLSFLTAPWLHDTRIAGIASDTCEIGRAHV